MTHLPQTLCPHVDHCGGCTHQTMDPSTYIQWKMSLFQEALGPLLTFTPDFTSVSPNSRIRATLHASPQQKGKGIRLGFYGQRSRDIVDMHSCRILHPRLLALLPWLRDVLKIQVTVDIHMLLSDNGIDLYMPQIDHFPHDHPDVCRVTTKKDTLTKAPVTLTFGTIPVSISPGGFTQATLEGGNQILRTVESYATGKKIVDLFTGSGALSLPLAKLGHQVLGVDNERAAIANLQSAARQHQLTTLTAEVRDLYKYPLSAKELSPFHTVVLDPPRPGALAQIKEIAQSRVRTVVYVSCNPQSFAKDAQHLSNHGFTLKAAHIIDQFLWTKHLESVVLLER